MTNVGEKPGFEAYGKFLNPRKRSEAHEFSGGLILWFSWYEFNPGSTLYAMDFVGFGRVATNTTLAACAAGLTSIIYGYFMTRKWDASCTTNGFLRLGQPGTRLRDVELLHKRSFPTQRTTKYVLLTRIGALFLCSISSLPLDEVCGFHSKGEAYSEKIGDAQFPK